MSLPRYPEYKDSCVAWLGEVPGHWDVQRLKYSVDVRLSNIDKHTVEDEPPVLLCNYVDVYKNERIDSSLEFMAATASEEQIRRLTLEVGDVIITKDSEDPRDIGVPALVSEILPNLVCGYHLALLRPRANQSGGYTNYLFRTHYVAAAFETEATGMTRYALGKYSIENLNIPLPTAAEQTAIATFLDRETGKVDALVAEQEKLIALLKEKRQAVISHAVTKGLNPAVKMKDSGIEWLGEVPEHWDVHLLKRAFSAVDYGISDSLSADGNIPVLRMGNILDGKIVLDDLKFIDEVDSALLLKEGDLLFNRTNSLDLIGKVGQFMGYEGGAITFASYLVRLRLVKDFNVSFFAYLLNTAAVLGEGRSIAFVAIGQCNLNPTRYGQITIPIPPPAEQTAITAFLDRETAKLDALTAEAQRGIELLKERRSALISAAVTGKIDVHSVGLKPDLQAETGKIDVCQM